LFPDIRTVSAPAPILIFLAYVAPPLPFFPSQPPAQSAPLRASLPVASPLRLPACVFLLAAPPVWVWPHRRAIPRQAGQAGCLPALRCRRRARRQACPHGPYRRAEGPLPEGGRADGRGDRKGGRARWGSRLDCEKYCLGRHGGGKRRTSSSGVRECEHY